MALLASLSALKKSETSLMVDAVELLHFWGLSIVSSCDTPMALPVPGVLEILGDSVSIAVRLSIGELLPVRRFIA